jgi:predicted aconitase with swiveling domain
MSPQIRYVLHPGYVESKNDGQRHYISASQLAFLYHVDPRECRVVDPERSETMWGASTIGLVHLYPKYRGDYQFPENP